MRVACVYVPQLALQSALRRNPEAAESGVALLETAGASGEVGLRPTEPIGGGSEPVRGFRSRSSKPRVTELDGRAREAGVRPGMTAAQAAAVCPGLRLLTATAADREAGGAALADVGFAFAPRVERDGERIFFDTSDLARLYPYGETAIVQAVAAAAARLGLGARVAIAPSKGVARVAARAREQAVVPADRAGTRAFLAPLPVELVTAEPALRAAFRRWGTRTAGAVARLPAAAVALRLGGSGADVARLCRGEDDEPFVPQLPPDALEEAIELDYPVYELEPLAFVLRGLIDRALARLAARSLACAGLTLRLALDPRGLDVRTVPIAAPTREAKTLLELVRLDLARRPPDAAVVGARIVAIPARVRATQLDILRPTGPAPDKLAATLARLAALVGPENVGAPATVDTWREEAIDVKGYAGPSAPAPAPANDPTHGARLSIRRRRPPEEIEVLMGPRGPTALRGKETTARVLVAAGPYRLSGEWWRAAPGARDESDDDAPAGWAREYWDVHASDGAVYRLHRDARDGRFYLDGYYD
jgi:protein ImuB